jgi:hypothetical protein
MGVGVAGEGLWGSGKGGWGSGKGGHEASPTRRALIMSGIGGGGAEVGGGAGGVGQVGAIGGSLRCKVGGVGGAKTKVEEVKSDGTRAVHYRCVCGREREYVCVCGMVPLLFTTGVCVCVCVCV